MDVDEVDRCVAEWKRLGIRDDERKVDTESPRPLAGLKHDA